MESEKELESLVLEFLSYHPKVALVWRSDSGFTRGRITKSPYRIGVSDIQGVLRGGRALLIELKTPKGKVRPAQKEWLRSAARSGAAVGICRSLEEVESMLNRINIVEISS